MDTCEFSYISTADSMRKRVVGIEKTWEELKEELNRTGPGCSNAHYFKTISPQGPKLFAVLPDDSVLFHQNGMWHRYITAYNVKFGFLEESNLNSDQCADENEVKHVEVEESDWVFVPEN